MALTGIPGVPANPGSPGGPCKHITSNSHKQMTKWMGGQTDS